MNIKTVCLVGLGYVGLPLAYALAKKGYTVIGYDINEARIAELQSGTDNTNELTDEQLAEVDVEYSCDPACMSKADAIILAIPTPVDEFNRPDLIPLEKASASVGKYLTKDTVVVYESTVYPGVTEEICGPILEKESGLKCGVGFKLGYSPERINPGDKEHTVFKIVKVVAGQDEATTTALCDLYGSVIEAGIHRAPNIKTAEMAKAIENAQRDLNIAFVNEVAMLSNKIGISSKDVLDAAGTKWNFLPFKPGLVGGHCIGVDPYYLVEKAAQLKMKTHVITAGRGVNDTMGQYVADQIIKHLTVAPKDARILVLGLTFKQNVPDDRNSKSGDVITALESAGCTVLTHDSELSNERIEQLGYKQGALDEQYDAVALLVPHQEYVSDLSAIGNAVKTGGILYDLKSLFHDQHLDHCQVISL